MRVPAIVCTAFLVVGLFFGFIIGAFAAVGSADRIVKMYAERQRLFWVEDSAYEIKEVEK